MPSVGTRKRADVQWSNPPQGKMTKFLTRDLGMSKLVSASLTFVNSTTKQVQGAASTFTNFAVGDTILVEGTNLNNGYHNVIATDTSTYLTLAASPQNEGPISCTIRSA
jgi:hypothetical protein